MKLSIVLIVGALLLTGSCNRSGDPGFRSETRGEFGFKGINAGAAVSLIVTVGGDFSVAVEGESGLLQEVKTLVSDEILSIKTTTKVDSAKKVRVRISMPELRSLEIWGASQATVTRVSGDEFHLRAGGSSSVSIDGDVKSLDVGAAGACKIDAEKLQTGKTVASASGASSIVISVSNDLEAEAFGASSVFYVGKPKIGKKNTVGSSEVREK